jgi:hypothetical protein
VRVWWRVPLRAAGRLLGLLLPLLPHCLALLAGGDADLCAHSPRRRAVALAKDFLRPTGPKLSELAERSVIDLGEYKPRKAKVVTNNDTHTSVSFSRSLPSRPSARCTRARHPP